MKRTKIVVAGANAIFWVVLGLLACYGALRLGLGTVTDPGPGFIFFWGGWVLVVLALALLVDSFRSAGETAPEMVEINWAKIVLVLFSLLLYAFFLETLGFVLAAFVLLSFLLRGIEGLSWVRSFAVASAAALASFGIFELWLKVRLPKGFFGF